MAEKRMFAKSIVLSDAFLDMPMSARCLYFTLGMFADDDGFVGSPKGIMRQCGASEDDMRILLAKRYLLDFESGVIVIKHWRINNYLRGDRYKETTYTEEKAQLYIDEKGAYTDRETAKPVVGIPSGIPSIDKIRLDKNSIDKYSVDAVINSDSDFMTPPIPLQPVQMTDIDQIIEAWNAQNCTRDIQRISFGSPRYNNLMICVNNDLANFLLTVKELDKQAWLTQRAKDGELITFDWFVNPTNYQKVVEGNYRELRKHKQDQPKAAQTEFNNFHQRETNWGALEAELLKK